MARLQDFQTVTPTSSDKLLVVQSQSQGLVPYGSKLDSANPTGTGKLSMNRKANTTEGSNSATLGSSNEASGAMSMSFGYSNKASGSYSTALCGGTKATGNYSFAEGDTTEASGDSSHSSGRNTIANHFCQNVFGAYNIADTSTAQSNQRGNYVEIVGNGTGVNARSNARTLDWSGNEVLAGDLTINGSMSVGSALAFSSGNITWNDTNVTGDTTRKVWQKLGRLVVANIEFTPIASKIAHQTVIATGFPLPLNSNYSVFDNGGQQVRVGTNGDLSYYFPTDTTTIRRHELTIVYFTA